MEEITKSNPNIVDIDVASITGEILAHSSGSEEVGLSLFQHYPPLRLVISAALTSSQDDVFLSPLMRLDNDEMGSILISPITDGSNTMVIKLLLIETSLDMVNSILSEIKQDPKITHHVYIIDNDGQIVTSTDKRYTATKRFSDISKFPQLINKSPGQRPSGHRVFEDYSNNQLIAGYTAISEHRVNKELNWNVITVAPYQHILEPAKLNNQTIFELAFLYT